MKAKQIKLEAESPKTKSVQILPGVHKSLKIHVAKTGQNITEFVSSAILEKLSK